ncbi:hypothetical protein TraAM80_09048 [Trypanosoma rangeli]|uniref:Uncharacterized protein n=1 Tax=Trypanosoma rangeli TaxID=5698 RepID=A0A422MY26_TRYRA|nr:uncharacterized protein TraAM80_09048 [Trypanosoma rangeli]RNE98071.1 hypothetical protein TraAM80_09048 [Trypanosoma rangeli]|eukprot:RNE98071.1 hypothetical protein TraAM80_09048 [Trypanosoma rangeli]
MEEWLPVTSLVLAPLEKQGQMELLVSHLGLTPSLFTPCSVFFRLKPLGHRGYLLIVSTFYLRYRLNQRERAINVDPSWLQFGQLFLLFRRKEKVYQKAGIIVL